MGRPRRPRSRHLLPSSPWCPFSAASGGIPTTGGGEWTALAGADRAALGARRVASAAFPRPYPRDAPPPRSHGLAAPADRPGGRVGRHVPHVAERRRRTRTRGLLGEAWSRPLAAAALGRAVAAPRCSSPRSSPQSLAGERLRRALCAGQNAGPAVHGVRRNRLVRA